MIDLEIIDDFLPACVNSYLEEVASNPSYPYSFIKDVTHIRSDGSLYGQCPGNYPPDRRAIGFASTPFAMYSARGKEWAYFAQFEAQLADALPECPRGKWILNRLRVGLNVPQSSKLDQFDVDYDRPHIDDPANGRGGDTLVCLYYVNDTDGDTVVFNEQGADPPQRLTIKQRVEPKRNRLLIFDGAYYHASSCPKHHDYRLVITVNYHDKVYD